jgi:hypothetical protein
MSGDHNLHCSANQPKEKDKQAEKQEPVAWMQADQAELYVKECRDDVRGYTIPLYTAPQREWVSLTDEQIDDVYYCVEGGETALETWREQARAVEAMLKEKNT